MIRRLLENTGSNILVHFLRVVTTFIMAPVIVRALGNYDYGIWEILMAVVGYMGILDLGIQPAITRYVARHHALSERKALEEVYSTSLLFMGGIGIVGFIGFLAWGALAPELLAAKGADPIRYTLLLLILGAQILLTFPGYVMECIHEGYQRYTLKNLITTINILIGLPVLWILLSRGYGLLTLALGNAIGLSVKYGIYWLLLRRPQFGGFRFRRASISWGMLKELFTFSLKTFALSITTSIGTNTGTLVIGGFLGPVAVAFYAIPAKLILQVRGLMWTLTQAFMPYFSDLDARGDRNKMGQVLIVASRYVVGIVLPMLGGIGFLGVPFLHRWMGPEYAERGRWILLILLAAYGLQFLNPFHGRFLTGMGQQGILAVRRGIFASMTVLLSLSLVHPWGNEGAALAVLIPALLVEPWILHDTCERAGLSVSHYLAGVLRPLLLPFSGFFLAMWAAMRVIPVDGYAGIVVVAGAGSLAYGILFVLYAIPREEQRWVIGKLKGRMAAIVQ